jgi:hypothetical protein
LRPGSPNLLEERKMDEQEQADFAAYMTDQGLWDLEIFLASKSAEIREQVRRKLASREEAEPPNGNEKK